MQESALLVEDSHQFASSRAGDTSDEHGMIKNNGLVGEGGRQLCDSRIGRVIC